MSNEPTITIPLSLFASCIFKENADPDFPEITIPLSKHPSDLAKVHIIPACVGRAIQQQDVDENYFHVELFQVKERWHAELWLAFEWRESVTRHERWQKAAAIERLNGIKKRSLVDAIADQLTAEHFDDEKCQQMAESIAANYKKHNITAILKQFDLLEIIAAYEEDSQ